MNESVAFVPSTEHKVLVTGGAGHVGSGLIAKLVELGYGHVTSIDNYSNGSRINHVKGCTYLEADTSQISSVFIKNDFDQYFMCNIRTHSGDVPPIQKP